MKFSNSLIFKAGRRYVENEQPSALHDAVYRNLCKLSPPWGLDEIPQVPMKKQKGAVTFGVKYTLVKASSPIKSFVLGFMNRRRTESPSDASMNDDTLSVAFYPQKVQDDWRYLLDVVFPAYISATSAYVAVLYDEQILADDALPLDPDSGEYRPNPQYVDMRNGVFRIWQANFWDTELCRRAFALTPLQIVERLDGRVANCRIFRDGVIVICTYEPTVGCGILELNELVLPWLHPKS